MHKIINKIVKILFILFLVFTFSKQVFASPQNVTINTQINSQSEVFTGLKFKLVNDQKNKTLSEFELTLPSMVKDLKIISGEQNIPYTNISDTKYKLTLDPPLYYNSTSDISITFQNLSAIKKKGKLTEVSLIGYDFGVVENTVNIDKSLGTVMYNSCNCKEEAKEGNYVFNLNSTKPTVFYLGTFQSYDIRFKSDLVDGILDINLPDNEVNQLTFYDSSNTIPDKLIYNQNFNLYAEFNSKVNLDFKYSVIREKLEKNIISADLEKLYNEFVNKYQYCLSKPDDECKNLKMSQNFQSILSKNSINSRIVCGYQIDYFKANNTLSYWIELGGENGIQEVDPFLQIQTGFDYLFQKDPNRFKINNFGDQISLFKDGVILPKQMSIELSQASIKIDDNVIESRVLKKQNVNEKIPENYFLLFTNKSSQIITVKDIKLSPVNTLLLSNNDKLYIYPTNSIEIDLGSFFEDLKSSTKITYSYKINNRWVTSSYDIDKSNWVDDSKVSFITTAGYIILISLSIFFGLWLVIKREA